MSSDKTQNNNFILSIYRKYYPIISSNIDGPITSIITSQFVDVVDFLEKRSFTKPYDSLKNFIGNFDIGFFENTQFLLKEFGCLNGIIHSTYKQLKGLISIRNIALGLQSGSQRRLHIFFLNFGRNLKIMIIHLHIIYSKIEALIRHLYHFAMGSRVDDGKICDHKMYKKLNISSY